MLAVLTAACGVVAQRTAGGVLINGRTIGASALRPVTVLDTAGATRTVDELIGKKGVVCYLRHLG